MRFLVGLVVVLAGGALVAIAACEDAVGITPCDEIPAGGCPRRGDTCADVTCDAVYLCESGAWTRLQTCPAREAGPDAGNLDAGDGQSPEDAAPPRDASYLDVPGSSGGPGCDELEPPDCPLARAAACPANQCCGCEDLFVCRNGGWELWGTCSAGGLSPAATDVPRPGR